MGARLCPRPRQDARQQGRPRSATGSVNDWKDYLVMLHHHMPRWEVGAVLRNVIKSEELFVVTKSLLTGAILLPSAVEEFSVK